MLLSLDGTLVVQLVNFVIFLVILNAIFLRPVGCGDRERAARTSTASGRISRSSKAT